MKNNQLNRKLFTTTVNNATAKNKTSISGILKMSTLFFITIVFLLGTTSCSRNTKSGCGTWEVTKYKKSNEYNSYRKYN